MLYLDYWKDTKGYEDKYAVSCCGITRSWDKHIIYGRWKSKHFLFKKGRILKPGVNIYGYPYIFLHNNGKRRIQTVHRLVAEAFIPNPKNFSQINHKNGIKTDNRFVNLEWCDNLTNMKHAVENGLMNTSKGENHCKAKLTNKQVVEIKKQLRQGVRNIDLAKKYDVSSEAICNIKHDRNWKHIK